MRLTLVMRMWMEPVVYQWMKEPRALLAMVMWNLNMRMEGEKRYVRRTLRKRRKMRAAPRWSICFRLLVVTMSFSGIGGCETMLYTGFDWLFGARIRTMLMR